MSSGYVKNSNIFCIGMPVRGVAYRGGVPDKSYSKPPVKENDSDGAEDKTNMSTVNIFNGGEKSEHI